MRIGSLPATIPEGSWVEAFETSLGRIIHTPNYIQMGSCYYEYILWGEHRLHPHQSREAFLGVLYSNPPSAWEQINNLPIFGDPAE